MWLSVADSLVIVNVGSIEEERRGLNVGLLVAFLF